jgi:hypothetical protein
MNTKCTMKCATNRRYTHIQTRHIACLALAAIVLLSLCGRTFADAKEDALKKRTEERYPRLRSAKDAAKVGETSAGLIEAVDPKFLGDADLKKLVDEENADRKEVYQLIADQGKTSADVVAKEAAKRNFTNARKGDYLKGTDGKWTQK